MFYCIKTIERMQLSYSIKITYSDNVVITADFKELPGKGVDEVIKKPCCLSAMCK